MDSAILCYFAAHHKSSVPIWVLPPVLCLLVAAVTFVFLRADGTAVTFSSMP